MRSSELLAMFRELALVTFHLEQIHRPVSSAMLSQCQFGLTALLPEEASAAAAREHGCADPALELFGLFFPGSKD